ncbi:myosin regulatory light chain 2, atrial isoform-like isoform X2 [Corythoichthys intestinalis]|uniref:myosin regulatory light chain 2, atrial isoform-like isoform X2 n=1 Tax=Corythoichthys intestinalis TaxID=161448 RepID=UPI0025A624CF|nr:myosin regulatory light chain 2, atrial isoform-like isoform X2 [Corythoichthys intestinalis]XP_057686893.1 myosin regulatory light chain 2, atrial isoform-like isoform X2 [Corythoichthys intestinalis]
MASKKASNKRQRGAQKTCSNVFSMFEQSQIQEFKEAFGCIDQDRDGVIKKQDLKETYAQLGKLNIKEEELDEMLNEGKGPINFTVFLSLFGEKLNGTDPEDTILAAFKLFDPNATGFVNKEEKAHLKIHTTGPTAESHPNERGSRCRLHLGRQAEWMWDSRTRSRRQPNLTTGTATRICNGGKIFGTEEEKQNYQN